MQPLGSVADMQARLAALRERHIQEQAEKFANLPPGTCERCYGSGRVGWQKDVACPECQPETVYAAGTPYEFQESRFSNYQESAGNQKALARGRVFVEARDRRDVYLYGGVGAGKSRLAAAILNECLARGKWCYFARVPLILHQLQPGKPTDELEHVLMRSDVLVMDDIGAERDQASDYTRRTLLMIYEERGDRGVRTIFTSNKDLNALAEMNDDDRLTSRIVGRADVVKVASADQRMVRRGR